MAVTHYTYLVQKMLGPNGLITVEGNFELLDTYDKEFHKMTQTFGTTADYTKPKGDTNQDTLPGADRSTSEEVFDTIPDAKKLWFQSTDPTRLTPPILSPPLLRRNFY
jgi:hypothetical protein